MMNISEEDEPLNCSLITEVPWAQDLFRYELVWNLSLLAGAAFISAITLALFIEQIIYIKKHFPVISQAKTIFVILMYPMLSITSVVGCLVPRAGSIIDAVGHMFLVKSLCQFMPLMIHYFGGPQKMWSSVGYSHVGMKPLPLVCCCLSMPKAPFDQTLYGRIHVLVYQFAVVRPTLMIVIAVIQINGSYLPGIIAKDNGFIYIIVLDFASTFIALYGLQLIQDALMQVEDYRATRLWGKFANMKLMMFLTVALRLVMGILVSSGNIQCGPMVPIYTRGDRIYHAAIVLFMLPMALWGRFLYRRSQETSLYRQEALPKVKSTGLMASMDVMDVSDPASENEESGL